MSWRACSRARRTASSVSCATPASCTPWFASTCWSYLRFWPTLGFAAILEPGPQQRERPRRRRSAPARRDSGARAARYAACARLDGERDADELRRQRIERCGLGVDATTSGAAAMRSSQRARSRLGRAASRSGAARRGAPEAGGAGAVAGGSALPAPSTSRSQVLNPKRCEELRQLAPRSRARGARSADLERQRHVALHGEQLARLRQPVARLAQVLADDAA